MPVFAGAQVHTAGAETVPREDCSQVFGFFAGLPGGKEEEM